jgi:hypothetical protein
LHLLAYTLLTRNQTPKEIVPSGSSNSVQTGEKSFSSHPEKDSKLRPAADSPTVTIFNDLVSNVTFSSLGNIGAAGQGRLPGQSIYFESTNVMVYIRGTEDEEGDWWNAEGLDLKVHGKGGVLVNAHYDRQVI